MKGVHMLPLGAR